MSDNPLQHAPAGELPAGMHATYWSDGAWRDKRRLNLYKHLLRPGELAFDVGANVGEVTRVLLGLGCPTIAVEPQPEAAKYIPREATIVEAACGATSGEAVFYEIPANRYLSTLRRDIADAAVETNGAWSNVERRVPVVTLDELIAEHGEPAFAKIDVEGFEVEVLRGLSRPLRALSFEVHSFDTAKIGACVEQLDRLGDYGYLYSRQESYELEPFPPAQAWSWYGDVYATLRSAPVDVDAMIDDTRPETLP